MHFWVVKLKNIYVTIALVVTVALLSLNLGGSTAAAVYFGVAPRKVPIYCVDTTEKKVAITFDSAWGADKTLKIIELLKEHNASATFFIVGFWAEEYPNMVKAVDEAGIEIGTHSNTHPDFTKLSAEQMKQELSTSIETIEKLTDKKITLFRAPFGAYNNTSMETCESMGLKTIQWDVDTLDWKGISALEITNRVLNKVKNGSIILCHNNSDNILDALPMMLSGLKQKGYTVTSVGNILIQDNFYVDHTGMQRKN